MHKVTELKEIREKDTKALVKELADLNTKMAELQFKTSFRRLKNFHEITKMRKRTARIWTVLNEKAYSATQDKVIEKVENVKKPARSALSTAKAGGETK